MYRLITSDAIWEFEELEEARRNQYIWGGKIEKIIEEDEVLND